MFFKNTVKAILIITGLCMVILTLLSYSSEMKSMLLRDHAAYDQVISGVNILYAFIFLGGYAGILAWTLFRIRWWKPALLIPVFCCWAMCGRTVAYSRNAHFQLSLGWYYLPTGDEMYFCNEKDDLEPVPEDQVRITGISCRRINFRTNSLNKTCFIGPFTWESCKRVFSEIGPVR